MGTKNLRSFLEELLDSHIERQFLEVQKEVLTLQEHVREEASDPEKVRSMPPGGIQSERRSNVARPG